MENTGRLTLNSVTWSELVEHLMDAGVIDSPEDVTTHYHGRGQRTSCFAFTVGSHPSASLKLAAALAAAFNTIPGLVELAADGIGVFDLLASAETDNMGRSLIVYFPGHTVDASHQECGVCDARGHTEHNCPV